MGAVLCRTVVAGAVPAWVGDRLNAELHEGAVVHAGSDAIYFTSDKDVIGVTSRHATSIPCAVATRLERLEELFDGERLPDRGGDLDGAGAARLPARTSGSGGSSISKCALLSGCSAPDACAAHRAAGRARLRAQREGLTGLTTPPRRFHPCWQGTGLTPSAMTSCGLLATLLAAGVPEPATFESALELAAARTTPLSATLLRRAGAGDVCPPSRGLFPTFQRARIDSPRAFRTCAPSVTPRGRACCSDST